MPPAAYAVATADTKGVELAFVAGRLRAAGVPAVTVDVGTLGPPAVPTDVSREAVAAHHPAGPAAVFGSGDRGRAVAAMGDALRAFLLAEFAAGKVDGVVGLGGTGGTALVTAALRALPVGLPKVMVSTVGGGNVSPYVDCSDITMVPSVVDVAGLNAVSRPVLANAAHALAGMVLHRLPPGADRPAVGMTMFGVTTPCVDAVRRALDAKGYDPLVFHATGTGGRAMEKLVASGLVRGVLDVTTTEVADEVVGGIFPAGPARFDAILESRVPYVLSLGALDMVNFGAPDTVPARFRDRLFHAHNPQVTLMRTTAGENRRFARWIAAKLNRSVAPVVVLVPEGGVSALDAPGRPFHDPAADATLFDELDAAVERTPTRQVRRLPHHVNDPAFAAALVDAFAEVSATHRA
jgi:uncharacterized protein (UPF0261 family)